MIKERKEFRKEREKHFEHKDHSFTAAVYGQPVHFMEDGEWKDIDNTVEVNAEGRYENRQNDMKVSFAADAADERLVEIKKDGYRLSWKMEGLKKRPPQMKKPVDRKPQDAMALHTLACGVDYENVQEDMDLSYVLKSKTLKENVIFKQMPKDPKITFEIATALIPVQSGGRVVFQTEDGTDIFVLPAPYMYDAKGKMSPAVEVLCERRREPGKVLYTLIPDETWMRAPERAWPVTVDPVVTSSIESADIEDTNIISIHPNDNHYLDMILNTGEADDTGISRALVKFKLPELEPSAQILNAQMHLYCYDSYGSGRCVEVRQIESDWNCQTVTWNTAPDYSDKILEYQSFTHSHGEGIAFDLTGLVRAWYAGEPNYGILLKERNEVRNFSSFLSSDIHDGISEIRPKIYIQYVHHMGVQNFWTYHTQDVRRAGQVHVNDHNGNLHYSYSIHSTSGGRMPYAAELVYNTGDRKVDIGYGRGFRLNYHQTIKEKTIGTETLYEWIDDAGTRHYFQKDSEDNTWKDAFDPDLKLTIDDTAAEKYTIRDKEDNILVFDSNGRLIRQADAYAQAVTVAYDGSGRIASVTDGQGRVLTFTYTSNTGFSVQTPDGKTKSFTLSGAHIREIIDVDGSRMTLTYTGDLLASVTDAEGYRLSYTYTEAPAKVCTITESVNGVNKHSMTITYGPMFHTFTDEQGRSQDYLFDGAGRTVSVRDDKGYGRVWEHIGEGAAVNRLACVSKLQYTSIQHLKNPHLFYSDGWSAYGTGANATAGIVSEAGGGRYGDRCIKLTAADGNADVGMRQGLNLERGKRYTFSGYVKLETDMEALGSSGAYLQVRYDDGDGHYYYPVSVKARTFTRDWEYLEVSFTVPEDEDSDQDHVYVYAVMKGITGTARFDNLQLEDGDAGGRRNLVENNGFLRGEERFERSASLGSGDGVVDVQGLGSMPGGKAFAITGDPQTDKRITQTIPLAGSEGDTYVISGWGKAETVPPQDGRKFGVELEFIHTDGTTEAFYGGFASSSAAWQYVNRAVVAKKDYTSIRASFVYDKHVGTASFDGLSVFKDEYWPSYTYDDKGELISCKDAKNKATEFEHNAGGDMTGFKTPSGAEFSYEYNGRHRVTAASSAVGKKYTFAYDSYGNITRQKLTDPQDAGKNILNRCVYENGKYPKEIYDPFGKCVRYDYNNASGELRSVTDVNGSVTSYTYDVLGRLVKTEKKDAAQQKIGEVSYTYEKDRIKTITKDGLEYRFGYDSLGHVNRVKVGDKSIVVHTYDAERFGLLTQSVLGNSQGVGYVYDDQDRVVRKTGINGSTETEEYLFAYDHEGRLGCVEDLVNDTVIRYQYSSAGEVARILWEGSGDFTYDYDVNGSLESITAEDGKKMSYTYDDDFAETRTMTLEGKKLRTDYDGLGRVVKKQLIDGMTPRYDTEFTYRATGQTDGTCSNVVESIIYSKVQDTSPTEDERLTYSYYDDGDIRKIDHKKKDANGNFVTYSTDYVYDALGQLVRVNDQEEGKTRVYTYNAGFNMTSEKVYAYTTAAVPGGSYTERTFTYDSVWKDQLTKIGNSVLTYDGAGNLTSYHGNSYTWKNGRQLAGITKSDGTQISYSYDHNGMRVKKTVGSTVHSYRYCGSLLMEEKTGSTTMRFSYDSLGNAVSVLYNGTEYYYMRNLQGDVIGLMNKNGEWVVRYRYDVWGNILGVSGVRASTVGQDNPFRYRGYYYDAETGLYYVSSRYYDPQLCRFICPDNVLAGAGESIQGCNLYSYCFNNPVNMDDPDGNWPKWATKVAVGVGLALCVAAVAVLTCGVGTATLAGAVAVGAAKGTLIGAAAGTVVGAGIGYSNTKTIEGAKTGAKLGFGIGASIGAVAGAGISGAQYGTFSSKASLTQHFEKHSNEFSNLYSNTKEYAEGAKYVINNGTYLPEKNAYIRFLGSKGRANYAFVGMKSGGRVSTFHVKSVNAMVKDGITLFMK